jgi:retron-type reverse transcriptase
MALGELRARCIGLNINWIISADIKGLFDDIDHRYPEKGTPQGGVISPVLSNIFLHDVLDDWFVKTVEPRMKGKCFLIRFADDFIIGCQLKSDVLSTPFFVSFGLFFVRMESSWIDECLRVNTQRL